MSNHPGPSGPSFLHRLKNARLIRVLAVYLGASWVVVQVVEVFQDGLGLPSWVMPVALLLLVIGLLVVLATAWVQSRPGMEAREAAGEVPDDWEVGLSDAKASLSMGELPHPTWARAVVGGVFAFALLFGGAGLYVVIQDRGESFQPPTVFAGESAPSLAVLPFLVSGAELQEWEEGMADLLSTGLDGAAGLRTVDTRTVLSRWSEAVVEGANPDLTASLAVARATGARFALEGSVTSIGSNARLVTRVHDLETGARLGTAQVDGSLDVPHDLVDRLALEVLQILLGGAAGDLPQVNLAAVTTHSTNALKAYLRGEQAYRAGAFAGAIREYQEAVALDSTFALAHFRMGLAAGWGVASSGYSGLAAPARERARELSDRLPERERLLVDGYLVMNRDPSRPWVLSSPVEEAARLYPNDAEVIYLQAETYFHNGIATIPVTQISNLFDRAVELDPTFAPYRIHQVNVAFDFHGDSARAATALDGYSSVARDDGATYARSFDRAMRALFGSAASHRAVLDSVPSWNPGELQTLSYDTYHPRGFFFQEAIFRERLARVTEADQRADALRDLGRTLANRGRFAEALAVLDEPDIRTLGHGPCLVHELTLMGAAVPEGVLRETAALAPDPEGSFRQAFCGALAAADLGLRAEFDAGVARLQELAPQSEGARAQVGMADVYWRWRREGLAPADAAREIAGVGSSAGGSYWVFWRAEMLREAGDLRVAADTYLATMTAVHAAHQYAMSWYHLGRIYDQLGDRERARHAWDAVTLAWGDGDPEVQPMVVEARERLAALE